MKPSRIDVIGQNGNDGEHYDGVGREWLIQSGLIASSGEGADRSGQNGLPDQVEGARPHGEGAAEASAAVPVGCASGCTSCSCGGIGSEGR